MRVAVFLASMAFSLSSFAGLKSQLDDHLACPAPEPGQYRILFIGDSITRHSFSEETIRNLGWGHVSGMAATSDKMDFPAVVSRLIQQDRGQPVVRCYHTYGGGGSIAERIQGFKNVVDTKPDLVVIQLGEHDDAEADVYKFRFDYGRLLDLAKGMSSHPKVVAVGPWYPSALESNGIYPADQVKIDQEMRSIASLKRVPYRSVSDIAAILGTQGRGTSAGVMWHPNDYGHSLYAQKIFEMYKQN
ncbi:TPA: SGNH/GDSL hydrolase family protein [Pseudomonas putida]|uniref:SGNH/GDSL hydrolase family protein n=1 Tax=Pseudomonas sp. NBRC 111132 TaxID=1661047 RepID=UPI0007622070|nr:SGNH/GDSL hydrolase family protein [Pseudomonas sp. NBRC 111132]